MIKLFFDIETLPGDESLRQEIATQVTPPGSMTKHETIDNWEQDEKPALVEERFRRTALRGHAGRVLCIGYIKEGQGDPQSSVLTGEEAEILCAFWALVEDVDLFVGYNVLNFDLKFIWQRSVIHGVRPSREISFARFRSEPVYDVMQEWEKWGMNPVSLDTVARALNVPSPKQNLDGSKVYDYYKMGMTQEIYDYCLADVRATKAVYERMNFLG